MRATKWVQSIATSLLALAASVADCAVGKPAVVDLTPAVLEYLDVSNAKTPDEKLALFRQIVIERHPTVYDAIGSFAPLANDAFLRDRYLPGLAAIGGKIQSNVAKIRSALPGAIASFSESVGGLDWSGTIYLMPSLNAFDGRVQQVGDRTALLLGIDVITANGNDPLALMHHELAHIHQDTVLPDQPAQTLRHRIWREGLATYVASRLNPNARAEDLLIPSELIAEVGARRESLARRLLEDLDLPMDAARAAWVQSKDGRSEIPFRAGYYMGYVVASILAQDASLADMMRWRGAELDLRFDRALKSLAAPLPDSADYAIKLSLGLRDRTLSASVEMQGLACTGNKLRLHLNRNLAVAEARVDGMVVPVQLDPSGAAKFWVSAARAIDLPCPLRSASLKYAGGEPLTRDGRNQVGPDLVELSLYSAWYPMRAVDQLMRWTISTNLPDTVELVSNADEVKAKTGDSDRAFALTRRRPVTDIALVASPSFVRYTAPKGATPAQILAASSLPAASKVLLPVLLEDMSASLAAFSSWLGEVAFGATPTVVFSLRSGPLSYARLPMISMPQTILEPKTNSPRTLKFDMRHELAHFWWGVRTAGPQDDWINEGFAEYFALRRTRDADGKAAVEAIIAEYRHLVKEAGEGPSVLTAPPDSPRGYLDRYVRPALLLDAIEHRVGRAKVDLFARAIRASASTAPIDSATVLKIAEDELGPTEAKRLVDCLSAKDWPQICARQPDVG